MKTIKIVPTQTELTEEQLCEICNEYDVIIEVSDNRLFSVYSPGNSKHTERDFSWSNMKHEYCEEISEYEKSRPTDEE